MMSGFEQGEREKKKSNSNGSDSEDRAVRESLHPPPTWCDPKEPLLAMPRDSWKASAGCSLRARNALRSFGALS